MATYSEHALEILKHKGYRITRPRRLVLEILESREEALSPYDIKDLLDAQGERVDTVSIYRILECLEENHLIHRMLLQNGKVLKCQLDDEADCHREQADHCHHFLVCRLCKAITEMHCTGLDAMAANVARQTGFQVEEHHLEFVGICPNCVKTATD